MKARMRMPSGVEQVSGIPVDGRRHDRSDDQHEAEDQFPQFASVHDIPPLWTWRQLCKALACHDAAFRQPTQRVPHGRYHTEGATVRRSIKLRSIRATLALIRASNTFGICLPSMSGSRSNLQKIMSGGHYGGHRSSQISSILRWRPCRHSGQRHPCLISLEIEYFSI